MARFRAIMDQGGEALYIIDAETVRFVDVNETACQMLGYSREELLKLSPKDIEISHEIPPERWRAHVKELKETGTTDVMDQNVHQRKDGTSFPVEVSDSLRTFGDRDYVLAVVRDITERKRAEEKLQETQAQLLHSEKLASLGTLVAGVAHEILNPLNILSMGLQIWKKKLGPDAPEVAPNSYDNMSKQIFRITEITQNLLQFARHRQPEFKSLNITSVVNSSTKLFEQEYRFDNVVLVRDHDENLPPVEGDEDRLCQVFVNLLSNAKDAMPNGGKITLHIHPFTRDGKQWVRVGVEDTGTGIPQDKLNKIFDPFFTTKPEEKGTGLGLSISFGIIQSHRGEILVESTEGKGTTFLVEFPAYVAEPKA